MILFSSFSSLSHFTSWRYEHKISYGKYHFFAFRSGLEASVPSLGVRAVCPERHHAWIPIPSKRSISKILHADDFHFNRKTEDLNTSPVERAWGGWCVKWFPTELQCCLGWRAAKTERRGLSWRPAALAKWWQNSLTVSWISINADPNVLIAGERNQQRDSFL